MHRVHKAIVEFIKTPSYANLELLSVACRLSPCQGRLGPGCVRFEDVCPFFILAKEPGSCLFEHSPGSYPDTRPHSFSLYPEKLAAAYLACVESITILEAEHARLPQEDDH